MTDHAEEQEMEAEALAAIFDNHFAMEDNHQWSVTLFPETDPDAENHVGCKLLVSLPSHYPEALPALKIEIIKGLTPEHAKELTDLANEEAAANEGVPSIFSIAERLREWLLENNRSGLDDLSMHAQMLRKQQASQIQQEKQRVFESQVIAEEMTEAEKEDLEVRKRRAEGTPCNKENFLAWKERFEAEMAKKKEEERELEKMDINKKKGGKSEVDKSDRLTGFQLFTNKSNTLDLFEAAAENAERDSDEEEDDDDMENVQEDLFDDDVDLDDMDFDDEDEDEEDEEEDLDI